MYSSIINIDCSSDLNDVTSLYNLNYKNINFSNNPDESTNKCLSLLTILEKNGYPTDLTTINSNLNITIGQTRYSSKIPIKLSFDIIKYNLTNLDTQVPVSFCIILNTDYDQFVNLNEYINSKFRNSKIISTFLPNNFYSDIIFSSFYNSVVAYSILEIYDARLFILNPIDININFDINKDKITEYYNIDYIFPKKIMDGNNLITFKNNLNKIKIEYNNPPMCFNTFNSLGFLYLELINNNIIFNCIENILDIPNTLIIPDTYLLTEPTIAEITNIKYLLLNDILNLDKTITNYKDKYIDQNLIVYQNTNNNLCIILYDNFNNEDIKIEQTDFIDISNTQNTETFKLITSLNKDWTSIINDFKTQFVTIPTKILLYSFGDYVYSFLRDLNIIYNTITPVVYIEALSSPVKNFKDFSINYNVSKYFIINVFQDNIVNNKVLYTQNLDDIKVNRLLDSKIKNITCVHTPFIYNTILVPF